MVCSPIDLGAGVSNFATTESLLSQTLSQNEILSESNLVNSQTNSSSSNLESLIASYNYSANTHFRPISSPVGSPVKSTSSPLTQKPNIFDNLIIDEEIIHDEKFIPIDDDESDEEEVLPQEQVIRPSVTEQDLERERNRENGILTSNMLNSTPPPTISPNLEAKTMNDISTASPVPSVSSINVGETVDGSANKNQTPKPSGWAWA